MNWKFRGWDKDKKKLYQPEEICSIQYENGAPCAVHLWDENLIFNFELEAFTGLPDKNGKEIFEGDICTYLATNMSGMEIIFENGCFMGKGPFNTLPLKDYFEAGDFESIEIIGSVHEGDR